MATDAVAESIRLPGRETLEERAKEPNWFEHLLVYIIGFETKTYSKWLNRKIERRMKSMTERLPGILNDSRYSGV